MRRWSSPIVLSLTLLAIRPAQSQGHPYNAHRDWTLCKTSGSATACGMMSITTTLVNGNTHVVAGMANLSSKLIPNSAVQSNTPFSLLVRGGFSFDETLGSWTGASHLRTYTGDLSKPYQLGTANGDSWTPTIVDNRLDLASDGY